MNLKHMVINIQHVLITVLNQILMTWNQLLEKSHLIVYVLMIQIGGLMVVQWLNVKVVNSGIAVY